MFLEEKKTGEVTLEPWRELLLRAADYMDEHGFCKRQIIDDKGRVCLIGAVRACMHDEIDLKKWWLPLQRLCGGHLVSTWNDRPETTKEMAVAKLRQAAYS